LAENAFPAGFRWGVATASYQIEGAVAEDGRGPSIWDTFSHTPGRIEDGSDGDVACDHYHRYREDVALIAELGLRDYRFSVAWPRVQPPGSGPVNAAGLDFYDRLVDELLAHGIRPLATLYHWDLPQPLQDAGGWAARDTAARFADYAALVVARLGDRVPAFSTLNEPWCAAFLGHASGVHAPGIADPATAFAAAHHLLLAHGLAAPAIRAAAPGDVQVSITLNPANARPASARDADVRAARLAQLAANEIFLDPLLRGRLPDELVDATRSFCDWSFVRDGDLDTVAAPLDFLGINYYFPHTIGTAASADPWPGLPGIYVQPAPPPHTGMGWSVDPASMTELLVRLGRDYPDVPIMITENGSAYPDVVSADGAVHDAERCDYLRAHVGAVADAIAAGVDIRGYYAWSLLDNFEWARGLTQRFGLVRVDYATQARTVKDSGLLYGQIAAANGSP
jgi:beta-glucosidase